MHTFQAVVQLILRENNVINQRQPSLFDYCVPMSDVHFKLPFSILFLKYIMFQIFNVHFILQIRGFEEIFSPLLSQILCSDLRKSTLLPLAGRLHTTATYLHPHLRNSLREYQVVASMTIRQQQSLSPHLAPAQARRELNPFPPAYLIYAA